MGILKAFESELHSTGRGEIGYFIAPSREYGKFGETQYRYDNNRGYILIEGGFFEKDFYVGFEVAWDNGHGGSPGAYPYIVGRTTQITPDDPYGVFKTGSMTEHLSHISHIKSRPVLSKAEISNNGLIVLGQRYYPPSLRIEDAEVAGRVYNLTVRGLVYPYFG